MTLYALLERIAQYGKKRKLINYSCAGSSIYEINPHSIKEYPILFSSPTGNHRVTVDTTTFSITLTYMERLEKDSINDIQIYSVAVENLKDIIRGIAEIYGVIAVSDEYRIYNFIETERMEDRVAGAYAQIEITVSNEDICPEDIEDNE